MQIETTAGSSFRSIDPTRQVRDVMLGETLSLNGIDFGKLEMVEPCACTIDRERIAFHELGRYTIRVRAVSGATIALLRVCVCDPACFQRIPLPVGETKETPDVRNRRIVANLAQHQPQFDGSFDSMSGYGLLPFGA